MSCPSGDSGGHEPLSPPLRRAAAAVPAAARHSLVGTKRKSPRRRRSPPSVRCPSGNRPASTAVPEDIPLVFEGGGLLGLSYIGVVEEFERHQALASCRRFAGTSAGAIIAGLLACGATAAFLRDAFLTTVTDFSVFADSSFNTMPTALAPVALVRDAHRILKRFGWCQGVAFTDYYGGLIEKLTGDADITLLRVHERFGTEVRLVTMCLDTRRAVHLSHHNEPHMPLRKAVHMSMAAPGIFEAVRHNDQWYVDGGILDNCPIGAYDERRFCHCPYPQVADDDEFAVACGVPHPTTGLQERRRPNPRTVAFKIIKDADVESAAPRPVHSALDAARAIITAVYEQAMRVHQEPEDWVRTVRIHTGTVGSFDFTAPRSTIDWLVEQGRVAARQYFASPVFASARRPDGSSFAEASVPSPA